MGFRSPTIGSSNLPRPTTIGKWHPERGNALSTAHTGGVGSHAPQQFYHGAATSWPIAQRRIGDAIRCTARRRTDRSPRGDSLGLEFLHEFPLSTYQFLPFTQQVGDHEVRLTKHDGSVPLLFSIKATKPA